MMQDPHRTALRGVSVCLVWFALQGLCNGQNRIADIGVQQILVNGRPIEFEGAQPLRLQADPATVAFRYGPFGYDRQGATALRMRHKLEGYDADWQEVSVQMRLVVSFLDAQGNEVGHKEFSASGQSPGWTGSFETSPLVHRSEEIEVPPETHSFWLVMTSAGGPEVLGAYSISDLRVKTPGTTNSPSRDLMQLTFERGGRENAQDRPPQGWMQDGVRSRMARVVRIGYGLRQRALAIVDDHPHGHAQWNSIRGQSPVVSPGERLVVEWDEMYSIGPGTPEEVWYAELPSGHYRFHINQLSIMGLPTDRSYVLDLTVPPSFWEAPWFWVTVTTVCFGLVVGSWRYHAWRRLEAENARLAQQQVTERERFRIARDIHDDLGARVTQISLASAMAERSATDPEAAREGFRQITSMARELVSSLYDTIWVVNPDNDSLEAVGHYLCQMVNQLTSQAGLRCRLRVPALPSDLPVSSHQRHNLSMAVKEAVNNVIKHAAATRMRMEMVLTRSDVTITIEDDGVGFDPVNVKRSSGLDNLEDRLTGIGGSVEIESAPGQGTTVRLLLPLSALNTVTPNADGGRATKPPASKVRVAD
jgi:signal transduction histidine kinase